ncbi:hypothetical protein FSS13T_09900 [Flavobacterium saliperosum S13]|uniref:Uncharacterized protein n=1 Tax=Flavobacterium saliperosum S13 TaxID=1341155 RepID=A0ABP2ZXR4_9FLAO|nr:hypothetical protein FSS13T_09900 [Flavobacterium saliperosum S13]
MYKFFSFEYFKDHEIKSLCLLKKRKKIILYPKVLYLCTLK